MPDPEDRKLLLERFSTEAERHFKWLVTQYGCSHSFGFSRFDGYPGPSSLKAPDFNAIPGLFDFIVRFTDCHAVVDLHYGDRELIIETQVAYPSLERCFYVTELMVAAAIPLPEGEPGGAWVHTQSRIAKILEDSAAALKPHWELFREVRPELIDCALEQRGQRLMFAQAEQRRRDRESACTQASRRFHDRDFTGALRLLGPFIDDPDISASSRKVYELARKYTRS